jgi:hypothetical protein
MAKGKRVKIQNLPKRTETLNSQEAKAVTGGSGPGAARAMAAGRRALRAAREAVESAGDSVRQATGGHKITQTERTLTNFISGVEGYVDTVTSFKKYKKAFKDFYGIGGDEGGGCSQ